MQQFPLCKLLSRSSAVKFAFDNSSAGQCKGQPGLSGMSNMDVTSVYRGVIDDVVTKSRSEFVQEGVDEAILDELRVLWEEKLQATGAVVSELPRIVPGTTPGSHVPTAPYLRPATQYAPGSFSNQLHSSAGQLGRPPSYMMAQGYAQLQAPPMAAAQPGGQYRPQQAYTSQAQTYNSQPTHFPSIGGSAGQPRPLQPSQPYHHTMQAAAQQVQRPQTLLGQPHYTHHAGPVQYRQQQASQQQYGMAAVPASLEEMTRKRKAEEEQARGLAKQPYVAKPEPNRFNGIPQQDGPAEEGNKPAEEGDGNEDAEEVVDNLSDVASENDEDEDVANICTSQFTKVQRTKNRWKCQLTAGVLHLNGRDHVFHSATGEMEF